MVAVPSRGRADAPLRHAPEAAAARALYERHARAIYGFCLGRLRTREEAEDATQSTFLNALRALQRGVEPDHEAAWLYKIAENVCLTRQRSWSRRRRVESPGDVEALGEALPSPTAHSEELIHLPEALEGMPEQQRRALLLREWQGLSYREIAAELGLTQAAVETLLFRARRSLADGLSDEAKRPRRGVLGRARAGTDAGSVLALLKTLLFSGGAKVVVAGATVAASSVVAATPSLRHDVESVVAPTTPHRHVVHVAGSNHAVPPAAARPAGPLVVDRPVLPATAAPRAREVHALPPQLRGRRVARGRVAAAHRATHQARSFVPPGQARKAAAGDAPAPASAAVPTASPASPPRGRGAHATAAPAKAVHGRFGTDRATAVGRGFSKQRHVRKPHGTTSPAAATMVPRESSARGSGAGKAHSARLH